VTELGDRTARLEVRVDALDKEFERTRARIHEIESDRATLRIVVQKVADLASSVEKIARQAAREAVEMYDRDRESERSVTWRWWGGWVLGAIGVTLAIAQQVWG
jgi:predicted  nucleic acid-binding Zn-ribbon protein